MKIQSLSTQLCADVKWVKYSSPQNVSEAPKQNSIAVLS